MKCTAVALAALVAIAYVQAQNPARQNPKNETSSNKLQAPQVAANKQQSNVTGNCGSLSDVALKVDRCATPLINILEGKIQAWPKTEQDAANLCNQFVVVERCIRDVSRRCTKGLHKTIISTLATATRRGRKRECIPAKYKGILRMTACLEKHQDVTQQLISNGTRHLYVIENQMTNLDEKNVALCCMVAGIEDQIKAATHRDCPTETSTVIRIYRAVVEDVADLMCRRSKCNDVFRGYKIPLKEPKNEGLIQFILRIVFSLEGDVVRKEPASRRLGVGAGK